MFYKGENMNQERIEKVLTNMLKTGGDFAEVFIEEKKSKMFDYVDSKLDSIKINSIKGVGLRLAKENDVYYASTNDFSDNNIDDIVTKLNKNIDSECQIKEVKLNKLKEYKKENKTHYTDQDIKDKMTEIDKLVRSKDKRITQVGISIQNIEQKVTIANQTGLYVSENRIRSIVYVKLFLKDGDKSCSHMYKYSKCKSLDGIDDIDFDKEIDEVLKEGLDKLYASPCLGKMMPVIIGPGFGGVIFHEACGHAMEATSVADGLSVLSNELNNKIASDKVTIIDDGTVEDEWGTNCIDDEGHPTQKNVLIENGVLKNFLIDELNNRKMKMKTTGSSRRESYRFAPTSRMNNTYLKGGTDSFEDMVKSIKLGLYAKNMGGGSVSTESGEFNFGCSVAYMIRDGKIAEPVKSACLIGNTKEILKQVEMVSPNTELSPGMCGSISGYVPVTVGQPYVKISSILVGGEESEG